MVGTGAGYSILEMLSPVTLLLPLSTSKLLAHGICVIRNGLKWDT